MNCYRCKKPLTQENQSEEHLIPNSVGGHTISKNLLCINCNSILGRLDAGLAKQLNVFMVLLNPKRDHGKTPPISATNLMKNEEVYLNADKTEIGKHPKYLKNDDGSITVIASRKKRLNQELKKIRKEKPSAIIEEPFFSRKESYNQFHSFSEVPAELIRRAILKITINHYIEFGGSVQSIEDSIQKLEAEDPCINVFIYPINDWINVGQGDLKFHFLNIIGDPKFGYLYGHVALFNYYRGSVLLSNRYRGAPFAISKYHPINGSIHDSKKLIELDVKEIKRIFKIEDEKN